MIAALVSENQVPTIIRPDLRLNAMLAGLEWQCTAHVKLGLLCQVVGAWFSKTGGINSLKSQDIANTHGTILRTLWPDGLLPVVSP